MQAKTNTGQLPNFLVIGAAKSGTSALYRYLKQHPEIFMSPVKEPHFFGYENQPPNTQGPDDFVNTAITDLNEYRALFSQVTTEKAIGEASPTYIHLPRAVERIQHHVPNAKLIAILRHPADRAFSAYMHVIRDQRETVANFRDALRLEKERIAKNWGPIWHYTQVGFYHKHLKRYYDSFASEQIRVYLYEDFKAAPSTILRDIFQFLEINTEFTPDLQIQVNVSGTQKSRIFYNLIHTLFDKPNPFKYTAQQLIPEPIRWRFTSYVRNKNLKKQVIDPEVRQDLIGLFREDICKLQDLIDRDLTDWLTP
ncbi:MAG: sulfotransferase [Bacteroidetes bacterium]|nr:sulfotransferase [Bacteroidota bacterium]